MFELNWSDLNHSGKKNPVPRTKKKFSTRLNASDKNDGR